MDASRPAGDVLEALRDDLNSAADLVFRGRRAYDADRLLRLAAEAVLARVGEAADALPVDVASAVFGDDIEDWLGRRSPPNDADTTVDHDDVWNRLSVGAPDLLDRLHEFERAGR